MNTILFIENDTYWFQQISSQFMLKPEYRVEHSANLLEAMNRINSGANMYYAVVININALIKDTDTAQVIASIKEKVPFTKLVCVLENNDPHLYVSLTQSGANGVLIKPYSVDALLAEIEKDGQSVAQPQPQSRPQPNQGFGNPNQGYGSAGPYQQPAPNMPPYGQYPQGQYPQGQYPQGQNKGNIENPNNLKIDNLYEMGQQTGEMHEFRPKQPHPNQQQPYGQNIPYSQGSPYGQGQAQQPPNFPPSQGHQGQQGQQNFAPQGGPPPYPAGARPNHGIVRIPENTTIAVHCPKGGVGKSSISKELAITYALSGVNGQPLRVCLVDMDIDYGDIAVMLELKQNKSIADWARTIRSRIGNTNEQDILFSFEEIEKYYLLDHKSGLKVLAAPTNWRDAALINEQIVRIIINNLKKHFDVIVIDTGNNVKDFTVVSMEMADHIVMVCNLDVSTINEILTLRKTLAQIQFPMNKIGLLMNGVKKGDEANIDQISAFLGIPLIGVLSRIQAIEIANNQGVALAMGQDNPFTIGIKKVANTILPVVKRGDQGRPGGKQRKSLFADLFKKKK